MPFWTIHRASHGRANSSPGHTKSPTKRRVSQGLPEVSLSYTGSLIELQGKSHRGFTEKNLMNPNSRRVTWTSAGTIRNPTVRSAANYTVVLLQLHSDRINLADRSGGMQGSVDHAGLGPPPNYRTVRLARGSWGRTQGTRSCVSAPPFVRNIGVPSYCSPSMNYM